MLVVPRMNDVREKAFAEWLREMVRQDPTYVTIKNMEFDVMSGKVSISIFIRFRELIADEWINTLSSSMPNSSASSVMEKVIRNYDDELLAKCNSIKPDVARCIRVMPANSFINNHIDVTSINITKKDSYPVEEIRLILHYYRTGIASPKVSKFRGDKRIVWVTKAKVLMDLIAESKPTSKATAIRNKLGLYHYKDATYLIGVIYPDPFNKEELRVPTFLEGGTNLVYRSVKGMPDNWGRAVDLDNVLATEDDCLPECIHWEVDFDISFQNVIDLGEIGASPPSVSFRDLANAIVYID